MPPPSPYPRQNFDPIARPYRWLEYLTFGPLLQRTRVHFLSHRPEQFISRRRALILGDGDGRFTATLLARNRAIQVDAVDTSLGMLRLLRNRCQAPTIAEPRRLRTLQQDALTFTPAQSTDLIVTHFFLDCLTQPELDTLANRLAFHAAPQALWLLSDFRIPPAGPARVFARIVVRSLYLAFRILTGLRTTRLPDHAKALTTAGFTCIAQHRSLLGLLSTELWQLSQA